jgi:hypothetical protein
MSIDAFQTGSAVAPRDTSNRAFANFNQTNDANRIQDILTALEYLRSRSKAQTVNLVGLETAGLWSYFARAMAGEGVSLAADLVQFSADTDSEYRGQALHPGLRRAGDFHAASVHEHQGRALISQCRPAISGRLGATGGEKPREANSTLRTTPVAEPDLVAWLTVGNRAARHDRSP